MTDTEDFVIAIPMPTFRGNGSVTIGQGHAVIGTWAHLDGPGFRFECRCGFSIQRFLKSETREHAHRHLEAKHRRRG